MTIAQNCRKLADARLHIAALTEALDLIEDPCVRAAALFEIRRARERHTQTLAFLAEKFSERAAVEDAGQRFRA